MRNFITYQLAVTFYRLTQTLRANRHLKEQLERAAASVVLNLAEGAGRQSRADQKRFYAIAFGSLRECQAIIDLTPCADRTMRESADTVAAHLYRLIQSCG